MEIVGIIAFEGLEGQKPSLRGMMGKSRAFEQNSFARADLSTMQNGDTMLKSKFLFFQRNYLQN